MLTIAIFIFAQSHSWNSTNEIAVYVNLNLKDLLTTILYEFCVNEAQNQKKNT